MIQNNLPKQSHSQNNPRNNIVNDNADLLFVWIESQLAQNMWIKSSLTGPLLKLTDRQKTITKNQ